MITLNSTNLNITNLNTMNLNRGNLAAAKLGLAPTRLRFYFISILFLFCFSLLMLLNSRPAAAQSIQLTNRVDTYQNSVGDTVLITIEATNQDTDLADIVVSAALPTPGVNFVSATASQGTYDHNTGSWAIENVDAGATETLVIEAIIDFGGYYVSEARLIGDEGVTMATARSSFISSSSDTCFAVADNSSNKFEDQLVGFSLPSGPATYIGATDTFGIEAASADPFRNEIYAINDLDNDGFALVRLNIATGQSSAIRTTSTITDADGLAYDPLNHLLYASTVGVEPELYHLNPNSGAIVAGPIALDGCRETSRVDALAVNPIDGQLIGICNFTTENETSLNLPDQLFDIDPTTGATSNFRNVYINGDSTRPLNDIEGLDFGLDGTLYGTTNTSVGAGEQYINSFFTLEIVDNTTVRVLDPPGASSLDGLHDTIATTDFEGTGCLITAVDLRISQQTDSLVVTAGQQVSYTLTVTNATNATAFGINITDTIPAHTTLVEASGNAQTTLGSPLVTWSVGQMAPGEVQTFTVVFQVNSTVPDGVETFKNTASVSEQTVSGSDPNTVNNHSVDTVYLPGNLQVAKLASAASASPGDTISYTISVANHGPFDVRGITFADQMPSGLTYVENSTLVEGFIYEVADTVEDRFVGNRYNNNDGSINWTSDWLETGDDDNPSSGNILASIQQGDVRLKVSGANRSIQRSADLSSQRFAELSFEYRREGLTSVSQYVAVQVSGDGGTTWAELVRFTGHESDIDYQTVRYDISDYVSANTTIRFETPAGDMNLDTLVLFDNVRIDLKTRQPSTKNGVAPPELATAYDLFIGEKMTITYEAVVDASLSPSITELVNTVSVNAPQIEKQSTASATVAIALVGQPANISGEIRQDTDGDGELTEADEALNNVTVELYEEDVNGASGPDSLFITSTTTDNDGRYLFENIPPGTYVLIEIDPAGYESITDIDGENDNRIRVVMAGSVDSVGNDFFDRRMPDTSTPTPAPTVTMTPTVTATPTVTVTPTPTETPTPTPTATPTPQNGRLSGQVREDTDNDGDFSDIDDGVPGVTVELFTDPDGDGDPSDGTLVQAAITDADGFYQFEDVVPGPYVLIETDLPNYTSTGDSDTPNDNRIVFTLLDGANLQGNDFLDALPASTGESPDNETELAHIYLPVIVK